MFCNNPGIPKKTQEWYYYTEIKHWNLLHKISKALNDGKHPLQYKYRVKIQNSGFILLLQTI